MKVKDISYMVVALSILIICSKISIEIGIIALTLQTFAVSLISYLLKWKKASIVFLAYILMGLIGIPVFSSGGGLIYLLKPSFGFILGFLLQSFITGLNLFKNKIMLFTKGILGLLVIYITGLIYMYIILRFHMYFKNVNISYLLKIGVLPFLLKDLFSVVLAGIIAIRLSPLLDNMCVYERSLIN